MHLPGPNRFLFFPLFQVKILFIRSNHRKIFDFKGKSNFHSTFHHHTLSTSRSLSNLVECPNLAVYSPVPKFLDHLIWSSPSKRFMALWVEILTQWTIPFPLHPTNLIYMLSHSLETIHFLQFENLTPLRNKSPIHPKNLIKISIIYNFLYNQCKDLPLFEFCFHILTWVFVEIVINTFKLVWLYVSNYIF